MSDDVAMTTGRLSVQPDFGVFRRAAGGTRTFWGFYLLSGRKQAAVLDGVNGVGWVGCVGEVAVAQGGGAGYRVRH